jgi:hypothetical protein
MELLQVRKISAAPSVEYLQSHPVFIKRLGEETWFVHIAMLDKEHPFHIPTLRDLPHPPNPKKPTSPRFSPDPKIKLGVRAFRNCQSGTD